MEKGQYNQRKALSDLGKTYVYRSVPITKKKACNASEGAC